MSDWLGSVRHGYSFHLPTLLLKGIIKVFFITKLVLTMGGHVPGNKSQSGLHFLLKSPSVLHFLSLSVACVCQVPSGRIPNKLGWGEFRVTVSPPNNPYSQPIVQNKGMQWAPNVKNSGWTQLLCYFLFPEKKKN